MKSIFEKDLSGEMVSPNEPGYDALIDDIFTTIKVATEMNMGYRTPEEVHGYMGKILGKPLEESIGSSGTADTIDNINSIQVFLYHFIDRINVILQICIHGNHHIRIILRRHQSGKKRILMSPVPA